MRNSGKVMQSLARIRDVVTAEKHALPEPRIRISRVSYLNDEYDSMDAVSGRFTGRHAKKHKGVSSYLRARNVDINVLTFQ